MLVLQAPLSVLGMPADTRNAFSAAIGHTFQILEFDSLGCMELDLNQKLRRLDTIWLEPCCCKRSRRPSRLGRHFRQHQEFNAKHASQNAT